MSAVLVTVASHAQSPEEGAPTTEPSPSLESPLLLRTWTGSSPTETMGFKVRDVGDVDGDGVHDFAVGVTGRDNGILKRAGAVDVYSSATGALLHSYPGHIAGGHFGNGIGFAGDVDGDGVGDLAVGSFVGTEEGAGYVAVFSAADGLTHRVLRSGKLGDRFGIQTHGAGDLDGDGHADILVGAPADDSAGDDAGRAYVFSGRSGEVLFTLDGERPGDAFGSSVAGDAYDGSGLFAIGARNAGPESRGRIYVYRMAESRPKKLFTVEPLASSHELGAYFLSFLGDVDADGTPDLYASDYADSAHGDETGRVRVISGRTGEPLLDLTGRAVYGGFGTGYGRAGDVDLDGHADIFVGSWRNGDGAEAGGAAFLYSGLDGHLLSSYTGRFPGRTFGHDAIGIGDVDGDGAPDLLVTNAGNSGVLPRTVGHVYLFSGAGLAGDAPAAQRSEAEMSDRPEPASSATSAVEEPLTVARQNHSPSWSPDGTRIAFSVLLDGDWEIALMRRDGSGFVRLTDHRGVDDSPAWAPDGKQLAFVSERSGGPQIHLMRPDGSQVRQLTRWPGAVARPSFSPDGRRVVFNAESADGTREIFVVGIDGGEPEQITDAPAHSDWPWWSSDPETIFFESDRSGVWQVYSMRSDGSGVRQISRGTEVSAAPVSSSAADGVVGHARRGNWEIVRWTADGLESNLTRHPADDRLPSWSPDGREIAFVSDRAGPFEIFVVDADGANPRQLTHQLPGAIDLVGVLRDEGTVTARALHERLREQYPGRTLVSERAVNALGYQLLRGGDTESAIEIFRFNAHAFPGSANVHDSLGEALAADGQKEAAILAYTASLELDPANDNTRERLRSLLGGATWEVPHDSADWVPDWSPDGRWVAYTSVPAGARAGEIVIADATGGRLRRVTVNEARDERPRWSPDGRQLAFNSDRDGQWEIYLHDLDTGEERRLTDDPGQDLRPDFSPDGRSLVFDSDRSGDTELYELSLESPGEPIRLTDSPGRDAYATYSPDGDRLAWTSDRDGDAEIFVRRRDGSDPVQLTHNEAMDQAPRWSPDGETLVFFSNRDGDPEIYRSAADGSNPLRLTFSPDWDFMPDFSPDGETVIFDSRRDGRRALYTMRTDGSNQRRLTNPSRSPLLDAVDRDDPAALATLHLAPGSPGALETELALAARNALPTDADLAFRWTALWMRTYPFDRARDRWVHSHLEALFPLLEARASDRPDALALLAIAAAKLERPEALALLEQAATVVNGDPAIDALAGAFRIETLARSAVAEGSTAELEALLAAERDRQPERFGPMAERRLNAYGYQLLGAGETDAAVAVLGANAELFPQSANAWDSLGEALWRAERREEALRRYERALELDPTNDNARKMIQRISAK